MIIRIATWLVIAAIVALLIFRMWFDGPPPKKPSDRPAVAVEDPLPALKVMTPEEVGERVALCARLGLQPLAYYWNKSNREGSERISSVDCVPKDQCP